MLTTPTPYTVNGYPATEEQAAILEEVATGQGHLLVRARAGAGKTSVGLAAVRVAMATHQIPAHEVLPVAFNVHNVKDWNGVLAGTSVTASTIHSIGNRALTRYLGQGGQLDRGKYRNLVNRWLEIEAPRRARRRLADNPQIIYEWRENLLELVNFSRYALVRRGSQRQLEAIAERFGLAADSERWLFEGVHNIIDQGLSDLQSKKVYDFTDMLYGVYALNIPLPQFSFIVADEAQDFNDLQRKLIYRLCRPGGRMMFVGDDRQAIMGFAGANVQSFNAIEDELGAKTFTLSVSWRCAASIIEHAQTVVPDIKARPGAPAGEVCNLTYNAFLEAVQPGEAVIARTTADCVQAALKLIGMGKAAKVKGQEEFVNALSKLAEVVFKSTGCSLRTFKSGLEKYQEREIAKLEKREGTEGKIQTLKDKIATLLVIYHATNATNQEAFIKGIQTLFEDADNVIELSVIHRYKGLESDVVYFLDRAALPLKWEKQQGWQFTQEQNALYVGLTRARFKLVFVDMGKPKKKKGA